MTIRLQEKHQNLVQFVRKTLAAYQEHLVYSQNLANEFESLRQLSLSFEEDLSQVIKQTLCPQKTFMDQSTNTEETYFSNRISENACFAHSNQSIKDEPCLFIDEHAFIDSYETEKTRADSVDENNKIMVDEMNVNDRHQIENYGLESLGQGNFMRENTVHDYVDVQGQIEKLLESSLLESHNILESSAIQNGEYLFQAGELDNYNATTGTRTKSDYDADETASNSRLYKKTSTNGEDYTSNYKSRNRKPFVCSECHEAFDTKPHLTKHIFDRGHNTSRFKRNFKKSSNQKNVFKYKCEYDRKSYESTYRTSRDYETNTPYSKKRSFEAEPKPYYKSSYDSRNNNSCELRYTSSDRNSVKRDETRSFDPSTCKITTRRSVESRPKNRSPAYYDHDQPSYEQISNESFVASDLNQFYDHYDNEQFNRRYSPPRYDEELY